LVEYGVEKVKIAVRYLREKLRSNKKPDNPAAYLKKLLSSSDWFEEVKNEHKKQTQKCNNNIEKAARRRRVEEQIKVLRNEAYQAKINKVQQLFSKDEALKNLIFEKVKKSAFSGYDESMTYAENLVHNPIFVAAVIGQMEKLYAQHFQEDAALYTNKIAVLERELK